MPAHVYEFAIAEWHYNPDFHQSLHDSWVESVSIVESTIGGDRHRRKLDISVRLLGPYHDGYIELRYADVHSYSMNVQRGGGWDPPSQYRHHGDWLIDEVRLSDRGQVVHEVEFSTGSRWIIESQDLTCEWKPFH
ncbi:MAG: hypothetical protein L0212_02805 [Acidobacteria bacterium]|nr:hypothetical protein [Acidobacteriota bacterium]